MKKLKNFFLKLDLWFLELLYRMAAAIGVEILMDPPVPKKTDPLNWYIVAFLFECWTGETLVDTRLVLVRVQSNLEINARVKGLEYFRTHPNYGGKYALQALYCTTEPLNYNCND